MVPGGTRRVDYRVSFVPSLHGQKMVVRIFDTANAPLLMEDLHLPREIAEPVSEELRKDTGLILVCGPTGSGKTTTLYSLLRSCGASFRNIITIEDPVEVQIEGTTQLPVDDTNGKSFAALLRSVLRQDPDVIMVGEVRDRETAEICLRAALTGHLVLSTLHTNDAVSAVNRLVDMGVEPFLLAATLQLLQAQRLIRRLCQKCRRKIELTDELAQKVGIKKEEVVYGPNNVECANCGGQGYRGRVGLFEVIPITRRIRDQIQASASLKDIYNTVHEEGIETLLDCGVGHVRAGRTSMEEVLTVALEGDD